MLNSVNVIPVVSVFHNNCTNIFSLGNFSYYILFKTQLCGELIDLLLLVIRKTPTFFLSCANDIIVERDLCLQSTSHLLHCKIKS